MGREREAVCGLKNPVNQASDHYIKLSGDPIRLPSTFSPLAAHRESADQERDAKHTQKNEERACLPLHSGAGPLHIPLRLSFVVHSIVASPIRANPLPQL